MSNPPDGYARILRIQRMLDPSSGEPTALVDYETVGSAKLVQMSPLRVWRLALIEACREGRRVPIPKP